MKQSSFGRKRDSRNLLLRNLATSVILYESVVTTDAKGRAIQPIIDRLIRIGQTDDALTARRKLMAYLPDENAAIKVLQELVPRFAKRSSGFTRRYRLPARLGDGAARVIIQLSENVFDQQEPTPKNRKTKVPAEDITTKEAKDE